MQPSRLKLRTLRSSSFQLLFSFCLHPFRRGRVQGRVRRQPDGVRLVRIVRPKAKLPPQTQLDGFGGPQCLSESCQLPNHLRVPLQERCLRPQQGQINYQTLRHWKRSRWPKVRVKIQIMFPLEGNFNTVYIGFCDYGFSGQSGYSNRNPVDRV